MKTKHIALACLTALWLSISFSAFAGGAGEVNSDLGVFALDEGNLAAAEKHFTDAIQKEPDNPYYHQYLGKTYLKTKRFEDAIGAFEAAWKLNPDIKDLQFNLAMANYEAGSYAKAEELFTDLVAKDPNNVLARYYLGMTYFKQDKYSDALPPLLQAGEKNESIRDNSYYFAGISHFKFDEPEKALDKLGYVETQASSEKLRHSARKWQEVIRAQQARSSRYNLYLKLGMEYDDNVRLESIDESLGAGEDKEDLAATAYFSGKYKFINTLNRKAGIGYSHYQVLYQDLSEFDLTASVFSLFFQERINRELYLSFNYLPSHYWVDGEHYLFRHQLSPTMLYRLDDTKGVRVSYNFTDNDYDNEKGRSGQGHEFKIDFITMLFNKNGDLTVGAIYENHGAEDPVHEYDLLRAHFEFSYAMPREWKLAFKGILYRKEHNNTDRVDDRISLGWELSRPIFYKWLSVQAEFYLTRNDSNDNDYNYEKKVAGLSLVTEF